MAYESIYVRFIVSSFEFEPDTHGVIDSVSQFVVGLKDFKHFVGFTKSTSACYAYKRTQSWHTFWPLAMGLAAV